MAAIDVDGIVEQAYTAHAAALRRRLTVLTHDPAAAEDLTQEAFVRLMVEIRAGDVPDNIGGWLWRVAHNLGVSRGRRMAVADRRRADLLPESLGASPETLAIRAEAEREVLDALDQLDVTGRTAVTMAAWGVSGPEIARTIGRTNNATRTLLCRARARVRATVLHAQPG
jgi:RNA polymerase sigma-70 factor (ECF subfamily)